MMEINLNTTVGEIVRRNFSTARIFEANNIDFCCGGNISLKEAAIKEGVDTDNLMVELNTAMQKEDQESGFIESLSLTGLCDYIVKTHHSYVNNTMPFLMQKLQKLIDVHGENHPELMEVHASFMDATANLSAHMKKEELILFPHIRQMEKHRIEGAPLPDKIGLASSAISQMEEEHQVEGARFMNLAEITNGYDVPPDGCNTFDVTYRTLEEFEKDLHRHIHLENNILFPRTIKLEKAIINKP
jgi:regulator of cell morphogenesis and NO signaling